MSWVKWGAFALGLFIASGVVAYGVASMTGVAGAQTPPPDKAAAFSHYEEVLAQKLGISVDQLRAAQKAARDQLIDEAVTRGQITADQATKLKSMAHGGFPGALLGRIRHGAARIVHNLLDAAAQVTGIDKEQIKTSLHNGQSLAQIAQSKGMDRATLKAGLASALQSDIKDAVANGRITQAQADKLTQALNERLDQIIDRTGGAGSHGGFHGFWPKHN